jgi:hypothetical protein
LVGPEGLDLRQFVNGAAALGRRRYEFGSLMFCIRHVMDDALLLQHVGETLHVLPSKTHFSRNLCYRQGLCLKGAKNLPASARQPQRPRESITSVQEPPVDRNVFRAKAVKEIPAFV